MQFPLSWLKEYVPFSQTPEEISHLLTLLGIEVEKFYPVEFSFDGVIVGKVIAAEPHPNADRLRIAQVFDGETTHQVVCGAQNCRAGIKTAFAIPGANLTFSDGTSITIKKAKLRGIDSFGMLCSGEELQLPSSIDGILEFPDEWKEGTPVKQFFEDYIFEVGLTPNLGHCWSILGIAREIAAALQLPLKMPTIPPLNFSQDVHSDFAVFIQDTELCPSYSYRVIEGVKIAPSPNWLQTRLTACGIKSINNVVDVTNYVLMEFGHPLHAFDFDKIEGKRLVIRKGSIDRDSYAEESFLALDGVEKKLPEDAILICDVIKPLAIAGVIGGEYSGVSETTANILLESAVFTPSSIRKTSKKINTSTNASKHFERGIDPNQITRALHRATALILEIAGGKIGIGSHIGQTNFPLKIVSCRTERVNKILKTKFTSEQIADFLNRLQLKTVSIAEGVLKVEIPSYRNDISLEIDLIEEIARIYGYNNLPRPSAISPLTTAQQAPLLSVERLVHHTLIGAGLQQFMTCDLISPTQIGWLGQKQDPLYVVNPTSIDQSILRSSLLPGLLQVVKHNIAHQNKDLQGFETGRIYSDTVESKRIGIVFTGSIAPEGYMTPRKEADFFDLKGIIEFLAERCGLSDLRYVQQNLEFLHPGRQAAVLYKDKQIGFIGEVSPYTLKNVDIEQRVLYAEIKLSALKDVEQKAAQYVGIPQFPASERDITISISEEIEWQQLADAIERHKSSLLEKAVLKDIYRSPELIAKKEKNVTIRFTYRSSLQTLSVAEVEKAHSDLMATFFKEMDL